MDNYWYVILENKQQGPYSFEELSKIPGITPDTLVWKMGLENWTPARNVKELKKLFKDKQKSKPIQDRFQSKRKNIQPSGKIDIVLAQNEDPYFFFLWIILVILIIIYIIHRIQ